MRFTLARSVLAPTLALGAAVAIGIPTSAGAAPQPAAAGGQQQQRQRQVGPADGLFSGPAADEADTQLAVGPLAGFRPDYAGSNDYEAIPAPFLRGRYRNTVFLEGLTVGVDVLQLGSRREGFALTAGPVLSGDVGRDEDVNRALDGLGDVDPGLEVGGVVELAYLFTSLRAQARQEVAGGHGGLLCDLELRASLPIRRVRLDAILGTTWADDDYMGAYFGISPARAARSGYPAFDAGSGFRDVDLLLGASYFLTDSWLVRVQATYTRLLGDAADSPIVEDAGSPDQVFVGAGLAYRFKF